MSQFTISTFEQAVARYFEPIARQNGWPLIRCSDHLYEIPSPHWVMQVSFHEGAHTRSMNVTLRSGSQKASDSHGGDGEIGVWPIAGYNGVPFKYIPWEQTAEGFLEEAQYMANLAKQFCLPYLLGQKSDSDEVREYWRKESEKAIEKIKSYKFPPSVQKRWHLPKPDAGEK